MCRSSFVPELGLGMMDDSETLLAGTPATDRTNASLTSELRGCQGKFCLDHSRMITIVQRVSEAKVSVAGNVVGAIGQGLVALTAVVREDGERDLVWTAQKLAALRIFRGDGADAHKHFDRDVREVGGAVLMVSNFTVAASTRQGRRPSLDRAAEPETAAKLFARLVDRMNEGAPLPAQGVEAVCAYCEMHGLCRRRHWS